MSSTHIIGNWLFGCPCAVLHSRHVFAKKMVSLLPMTSHAVWKLAGATQNDSTSRLPVVQYQNGRNIGSGSRRNRLEF